MITFIIGFSLTRTLNLAVNVPPSTASSLGGDTLGRESSGSRTNSSTSSVLARSGSMAHTEVGRAGLDGVSPKEALRPDKGQVKNNLFGVTPGQLNKLLNLKSLVGYKALGGLSGIARCLRADLAAGLIADETRLEGTVCLQDVTKDEPTGVQSSTPGAPPAATVIGQEVKDHFQDRIRVFKNNRLPERKTDSVWVLLWKAYNDKILRP